MPGVSTLLDKYERHARLAPGLLLLLPVAITVAALGFTRYPVVSVVLSLLSLAGGSVLISETIRHLGLPVQDRLWKSWGGPPTTRALRMREDSDNQLQRDRWRSAIEHATGVSLLSKRAEQGDPQRADQAIEAAVGILRDMTRDEGQFPILNAENRSYGFQRNFYGARHLGRAVALLGAAVVLFYIVWRSLRGEATPELGANILGIVADAAMLLVWIVLPSSRRIKVASDKYSRELLQAAERIARG